MSVVLAVVNLVTTSRVRTPAHRRTFLVQKMTQKAASVCVCTNRRERVDEGRKRRLILVIKISACAEVGTGEEFYLLCDPGPEL